MVQCQSSRDHYDKIYNRFDVGYKGHVAHEFIPTRDALDGLKQAVTLCDV